MAASRVVVHGDVQGVFFRDACRKEAIAAGVVGWVANRSDGTVEAHFEGDESAIEEMRHWCEMGSAQAQVERVEVTSTDEAALETFDVRD
jgi:acylphosphatase